MMYGVLFSCLVFITIEHSPSSEEKIKCVFDDNKEIILFISS